MKRLIMSAAALCALLTAEAENVSSPDGNVSVSVELDRGVPRTM